MTVRQVVEVLDRRDLHDCCRSLDLTHSDLRETHSLDLSLLEELCERAELLIGVNLGVDAVELEEVQRLDTESATAQLALLTEICGMPERHPHPGPRPHEARLGGDHDVLEGCEGLEDELLGDGWAIAVGRIDEVDAELDGSTKHSNCLIAVSWRPPHARSGQLHRSEPQSMDRPVTDLERSGRVDDPHGAAPLRSCASGL